MQQSLASILKFSIIKTASIMRLLVIILLTSSLSACTMMQAWQRLSVKPPVQHSTCQSATVLITNLTVKRSQRHYQLPDDQPCQEITS